MSKEIHVPEPETISNEARAFHRLFCGNQKYMMDAMYAPPWAWVWNNVRSIQQLVYLESRRETPNKHVMKRLIKRYHRLAGDAGVESIMED